MINYKLISIYCKDDASLIENYEQAINSPETWDCHHRLETELNISRKELIERELYFSRPASELIFLSHSEHTRLHGIGKDPWNKGLKGVQVAWNKGISPSEETRKKQSESLKGRIAWNKGLKGAQKSPIKNKHRVYREDGTHYYA